MYGSWEMVRDRQMDGRKKWHIEVGAPPKKTAEIEPETEQPNDEQIIPAKTKGSGTWQYNPSC